MQQNAKVTAFTVSALLREDQHGRKNYPSPSRLGLTSFLEAFLATLKVTVKLNPIKYTHRNNLRKSCFVLVKI